jgi:hypothetical protein
MPGWGFMRRRFCSRVGSALGHEEESDSATDSGAAARLQAEADQDYDYEIAAYEVACESGSRQSRRPGSANPGNRRHGSITPLMPHEKPWPGFNLSSQSGAFW